MKEMLFLAGSVMLVIVLMTLQLRSLKKYHPNTELLIGILKLLKPDWPEK